MRSLSWLLLSSLLALPIEAQSTAQIIGRVPRFFCYPYGRYDRMSRDVVAQGGFVGACSGRYDFNRPGGDPFVLRRVLQEPGEGTRELRVRLVGGYGFLDLRQRHMDRARRRS